MKYSNTNKSPSMAITTVSMHYQKLTSIEYYKANNNFLSEKNAT